MPARRTDFSAHRIRRGYQRSRLRRPFQLRHLDDIVKKRVEIRCNEGAILADAIPAKAVHCTRHVPVINAQGNLVGALSMVNALEVLPQDVAARGRKKFIRLSVE